MLIASTNSIWTGSFFHDSNGFSGYKFLHPIVALRIYSSCIRWEYLSALVMAYRFVCWKFHICHCILAVQHLYVFYEYLDGILAAETIQLGDVQRRFFSPFCLALFNRFSDTISGRSALSPPKNLPFFVLLF